MHMPYQIMRPRLETHFPTRGDGANLMFPAGQRQNYQLNFQTQVAIAKTVLSTQTPHCMSDRAGRQPTNQQPNQIESPKRTIYTYRPLPRVPQTCTFTGISGAEEEVCCIPIVFRLIYESHTCIADIACLVVFHT